MADFSIVAFGLLNAARVLGYLPQIIRIHRDQSGATAVSLTTWSLFAAANLATVSYAVTVSGDLVVAGVFGLNAMGCLIITGLTAAKRMRLELQERWRMQSASMTAASLTKPAVSFSSPVKSLALRAISWVDARADQCAATALSRQVSFHPGSSS